MDPQVQCFLQIVFHPVSMGVRVGVFLKVAFSVALTCLQKFNLENVCVVYTRALGHRRRGPAAKTRPMSRFICQSNLSLVTETLSPTYRTNL